MAKQIGIFEVVGDGDRCADELCPQCGQRVRVWKKAIISTAVASLCRLVAQYRGEPIHHDDFTVLLKDRNFSQLKLWGLIAAEANSDPAKRASGRWCPTELGRGFVLHGARIPKYVVTKQNRAIRFDGPAIGVREALGSRFNYQELIRVQEEAA